MIRKVKKVPITQKTEIQRRQKKIASEENRRVLSLRALIKDLEDSVPGIKSNIENYEKELKTKNLR